MAENVSWKHPQYKAHAHQVELVNQVYNGIDTAKALITQLNNEYDDLFKIRVEEATLENFIERIVVTMTGQVTRKPLTFEDTPDKLIEQLEALEVTAKELLKQGVKDGKAFILVDAPVNGGDPYFSVIQRPQLANWRKDDQGKYTFVVIMEGYIEENEDGFSFKSGTQYRVIDEDGNVKIWRESADKKGTWYIHEEIITSYNFIPFYELSIDETPPLYDIAKLNVKHLNKTSLKDRFLKEALDPLLFGKGLGLEDNGDKDNPQFIIGVNQMTNTDNTEADLKWVELDGSNYDIAEKDLYKVEQAMAVRALKLQTDSTAKTATESREDAKESTTRISDISNALQNTLNMSINGFTMIKSGAEFTGKVITNKDFIMAEVDSAILLALNTLNLSDNLSTETLLKAVANSEVVEIESIENEMDLIEKEFAPMEVIE